MSTANAKKMEYVRLGQSGLKISKIVLGCMSYGNPKWWGNWVLEEEEASKHIKTAYDAGINAFDTANVYSNGLSEEILGRAIKQHNLPRDEIVVMTKVYCPVSRDKTQLLRPGGPDANAAIEAAGYTNQFGLSRKHIFDSVKHSLQRLQLDYIDLLQCHRFDPNTPIEETMQALHDVVKAGYVRYIGMSSCYAWQFNVMQNYAINNKLTPFISMQNHYNLLYREEEREMFPTLKACDNHQHVRKPHLTFTSTLASARFLGLPLPEERLLGRWKSRTPLSVRNLTACLQAFTYSPRATRRLSKGMHPILRVTSQLIHFPIQSRGNCDKAGDQHGPGVCSLGPEQRRFALSVSAPIVGSTSLANLEDAIAAAHIKLTEEEIKLLEEPYQPLGVLGH
ncbi:Aldo-ket-red domain-containing protein [Mycena venus]|uniref:Aldo-ket-red domain-containing protein n=1 Tax=Mycena venus TaxID=2733690 RepID=A0A8H6XA53_9AGAR|nr:Aldo-ket-red domain-containing protein [Mycena venus]